MGRMFWSEYRVDISKTVDEECQTIGETKQSNNKSVINLITHHNFHLTNKDHVAYFSILNLSPHHLS